MTDEILRKIYDATPPDEELEDIADFFKVFGDNTRLKIMIALLQSELCVQDIADALQMTQSAISHQLKLLKQLDLVKTRRAGKTIFYSLADDHISSILSMGIDHIEEEKGYLMIRITFCLPSLYFPVLHRERRLPESRMCFRAPCDKEMSR